MLSIEKRRHYFKVLGFGYTKKGIEKMQRKYFVGGKVDGIYGRETDILLKHLWNVKLYAPHFKAEEFRCECGGKYCNGYPSYMKQEQLRQLEAIRMHWGKPITVTCGLRCKGYNRALNGSIAQSKHLEGRATDFYIPGVTDTLAHRKNAIKWIRRRPFHAYTYGDGINSDGGHASASYMGNALHTDTMRCTQYFPKAIPSVATIRTRERACIWAENLSLDNSYGYKRYNDKGGACHICHPSASKGYNCIGLGCAMYAHGGHLAKMAENCNRDCGSGLGNNYTLSHNIEANWKKKNGKGWKYISNGGSLGGKKLTTKDLRRGDILICYDSHGRYKHIAPYVGKGYIVDATSSGSKANNIRWRKMSTLGVRPTRAFRWMGGDE